MSRADIYAVWLSMRVGAGGLSATKLLKHFETPKAVYDGEASQYYAIKDLGDAVCERLCDKSTDDVKECLDFCEKYSVRILVRGSEGYPKRLEALSDAPYLLYAMGKELDFDSGVFVATVGSRDCSPKGERSARAFGYELAKQGAVVVSGLAAGIDAACHEGALEAQGTTVAVLGCGLDTAYPACNRELQKRILRSGTILTEYPPGTRPSGRNFPIRNRIISGLSQATAVIECKEGSGALITARCALKQGRLLYAVPGDPTDPACAGNIGLLKNGAKLVTRAYDVLCDFELGYPNVITLDEKIKAPPTVATEREEPLKQGKKQNPTKTQKPPTLKVAAVSAGLCGVSKKIVELLEESPLTADELTEKGIPLDELLTELTLLEIQGIITAEAGGVYKLK